MPNQNTVIPMAGLVRKLWKKYVALSTKAIAKLTERIALPKPLFKLACCSLLFLILTACSPARVTAEERMFLNLSLEFLGEYQLPTQQFEGTPVGGLSGLTYNRQTGRFYAISDDRSQRAPARFYTLNMSLDESQPDTPLKRVEVEGVTLLKNENGETFPKGSIDGEGIALSPKGTLFISSEGDREKQIDPFIAEFSLETGELLQKVPLPPNFLPRETEEGTPIGIQNNLAFESLTLNPNGLAQSDPYRLFSATEAPLFQDKTPGSPVEESARIRFLHYLIGPIGEPGLVAEHLYLLDPIPRGSLKYGLSEIMALDTEGFFLSLERTFGLTGFDGKLFQVVVGNATDISNVESLSGELGQLQPLRKDLLFDLSTLTDQEVYLDNLEGMTYGPYLPDGSRSLVLMSDNNFNDLQVTQFLLFRIVQN
jgi:hypothetical protein